MTTESRPLYAHKESDESTYSNSRCILFIRRWQLKLLPAPLRGAFSMSLYFVNTVFWCTLLFFVSFFKMIIPGRWFRLQCNRLLNHIANTWIQFNILNQKITAGTHWDVKGVTDLNPRAWYMMVANHQSWVDILVLQKIFHRKIPFIK